MQMCQKNIVSGSMLSHREQGLEQTGEPGLRQSNAIALLLPFTIIAQNDSNQKKTVTTVAAKTIFLSPGKDSISAIEYMRLANSGFYSIFYREVNDTTIVYTLDSTMLLKSIGKKVDRLKLKTMDGKRISIPKKQTSIINFWSTTCRPCLEEIDSLNALVAEYPTINFIAITPDSLPAIRKFLSKKQFKYKILLLNRAEIENRLMVTVYPTHFLIDRRNILTSVFIGKTDEAYKGIREFIRQQNGTN